MTGSVGPFAGLNVPWLLDTRARDRRNHPFVIWQPVEGPAETWTYGRFADRVNALAAGFEQRGLRPGDTVLIHLENCVEFLLAWFACAKTGAVAVTTNARAAAQEMSYFAEHSRAVAAITQPSLAGMVASACPNLRWIAVTAHDSGAVPAQADRPDGADSFDALFGDASLAARRAQDPAETCSVQFTSGTTARPKGVVWSHGNALWGARVNAQHEALRPDDIHLVYSPLFHTNALSYSLLATLWVGATAVVVPRFSASRFWDVAVRHRCTWGSMNSFTTRALLEQDVPPDHSFRLWGTPLSDSPALEKFGIKTIGWWGMTETISHGIVGDPYTVVRPVGVGRAAPEYAVRVIGEDGRATPVGGTGSLLIGGVRGLSLFKEYLHDESATRAGFDESGYFVTGDRVQVLDNGVLAFAGRAKDLLRVGGENVAALEIERVALGVAGVREAAVVAKPHPMLDEVPVMFVIPVGGVDNAGEHLVDDILAACRRDLAAFKVPREVRLLDEFPRAALDKVAKSELAKTVD
ncbi:ATP-dependent acyl-CoA ligase [Amycolatopsis endophytica]|uniref:Crotonobetaine/carnitine-CoA ligase n=1 Tax=Amycolatopsis endophytica TaxID=860233 RepID=A0A853B1L5_9PSEU|nr:AMP-binding protein [Amycolatopsis endophytica]NYI88849.1 crotonobetaine/carnitine-CoA ligase [Amycolatopsis endophytica]